MTSISTGNVQADAPQAVDRADLRASVRRPFFLPSDQWRLYLTGALALLVVGWITAESLKDLISLGVGDSESSHVLLAPVVVAWLVWVRRGRISRCTRTGKWTGAMMIAVGWLLWSQGYHYQIQIFWHSGALLLLGGTLLVILGSDAFWKFLPAWAALVFLLPMPARIHLSVAVPLERVTATLTQSLAEAFGINSTLSGNQLSINGIDVAIAEACSGLRMVFSLFMACYVFAFARPLRPWLRIVVLAAAPIVAIVCNVIRLVPTVWMFGHVSHDAAERFHDGAGWAMLGVAFLLLTGFTSVIDWLGLPVYTESTENLKPDCAINQLSTRATATE